MPISENQHQLSPHQILERKANFASDILAMYDTVCPGLTKERGLTLFELFSATFQLIKLQASSIMNGGSIPMSSSGKLCKFKLKIWIKFYLPWKPGQPANIW